MWTFRSPYALQFCVWRRSQELCGVLIGVFSELCNLSEDDVPAEKKYIPLSLSNFFQVSVPRSDLDHCDGAKFAWHGLFLLVVTFQVERVDK